MASPQKYSPSTPHQVASYSPSLAHVKSIKKSVFINTFLLKKCRDKKFFCKYFGDVHVILALEENTKVVNKQAKNQFYLPQKPGKYFSDLTKALTDLSERQMLEDRKNFWFKR